MGTDITNKEQQPRESHEPKKASKITITTQHDTSSPRMALTEVPKTKPASPLQTNNVPPKTLEVQDKTRLPTVQEEEPQGYKKQRKSVNKSKKPENFKSRLVKTMQEEPFVRSPATSNNNNHNKSNNLLLTQGDKSSLSINDIASFKSVPSLHTIIKKKDSSPHKSVINTSFPHIYCFPKFQFNLIFLKIFICSQSYKWKRHHRETEHQQNLLVSRANHHHH